MPVEFRKFPPGWQPDGDVIELVNRFRKSIEELGDRGHAALVLEQYARIDDELEHFLRLKCLI